MVFSNRVQFVITEMSKPNQKKLLSDIHCSLITQGNLIEDKALTVFEEFKHLQTL